MSARSPNACSEAGSRRRCEPPSRSPLALLVALVLADHQHDPMAADDLAFLAHRPDRRSYLHDPFRRLVSRGSALAAARAAATGSRTRASARRAHFAQDAGW